MRLVGFLDEIRYSTGDILLRVHGGRFIPATVFDYDPEQLRALFGRRVVITGVVAQRADGILAEEIELAGDFDEVFEYHPRSMSSPESSGLQAIYAWIGSWPGEETDEELLAWLKEIR